VSWLRGEILGLTLEPRDALRIGCECLRQHLESHVALEPAVTSAIDRAHPARSEQVEHGEGADFARRA
jgi:hypothetical protein